MKKFVVLLVVLAITCFSAMAFAADVTVGGSYEIRSRDFTNLNAAPDGTPATAPAGQPVSGDQRDTQNRIRIDVNAKAGDVKGKLQLESDFGGGDHDWGTNGAAGAGPSLEAYSTAGRTLGFREAWVNFNLPGLPVNVTGGHQLLTLGNGWFFRSMHFGSDAWVVANQTGPNTAAFVNVKALEGNIALADDVDAYVILDVFKINDDMTVGLDFTNVKDRKNSLGFSAHPTPDALGVRATPANDLYNLGANFNGKIGPVALKAEVDFQMGKAKDANLISTGATGTWDSGEAKFKGNQFIVQAGLNFDPVGVNVTLARGSGNKAGDADYKGFVSILDVDPHYTFLYEYKVKGAGGNVHQGFANTTALGAGVTFAATKSLTVGADAWLLKATEDVALNQTGPAPVLSDDLGLEVDLKVNWKLYDNLAWNWTAGIFKPGDAYKSGNAALGTLRDADDVMGVQGVLAFKF